MLLEKKPGAIHISDLCALGLLEAGFNSAMKILVGHWMVHQALTDNLIPSECYGSIPGCCAIQVSFSHCLLADLLHQRHHPLAIACEDFAWCYDQIAHCPASLACQHLVGVSPEVMSTIFFMIQFVKFYLHTAYGDSATFYGGGLSQYPFQGVCQGNGSGPAIWLALSLCLIHMLHQTGSPTQISSSILLTSITMVCFIYVNDCDLFALAPPLISAPKGSSIPSNVTWTSGKVESKPLLVHSPLTNVPGVAYSTSLRLASGSCLHCSPTWLF